MSDISEWSNSAGGNTSAAPDGAPEGMAPSAVNNTMREMMAATRRQMEDSEWFNWGDTPSRASATTFKIAGDVTSRYLDNRKIKLYDSTTLTGHVVSASYTTETTITVSASGSLTTSLTKVAVSILTNATSIPDTIARRNEANSFSGTATFNVASFSGTAVFNSLLVQTKGADVTASSSSVLSVSLAGNIYDVSGSGTCTGIVTAPAGTEITLRYKADPLLKHNASSFYLLGETDRTVVANSIAKYISEGSGNWREITYSSSDGKPTKNVGTYGLGDYIKLTDTKATNTSGGSSTSTTQIRVINTEDSDTGNHCTLSSNQFTLAPGGYLFDASSPGFTVNGHQASLYNVTSASTQLTGTSEYAGSGDLVSTRSKVRGFVSISASATFEIRHYTSIATVNGLGRAVNGSLSEVYTIVEIYKIA